MKTINLTQHNSTTDQASVDFYGQDLLVLKRNLTFNELPTASEIESKVETLVALACKAAYWQAVSDGGLSPHEDEDEILAAMRYTPIMVGGAPWLMAPLVAGLKAEKLKPVFAFTQRESVDTPNEDGTVTKTSVFVHSGWITA